MRCSCVSGLDRSVQQSRTKREWSKSLTLVRLCVSCGLDWAWSRLASEVAQCIPASHDGLTRHQRSSPPRRVGSRSARRRRVSCLTVLYCLPTCPGDAGGAGCVHCLVLRGCFAARTAARPNRCVCARFPHRSSRGQAHARSMARLKTESLLSFNSAVRLFILSSLKPIFVLRPSRVRFCVLGAYRSFVC